MACGLGFLLVDGWHDGALTLDTNDGHGDLLAELDCKQTWLDRDPIHVIDGEGEALFPGLIIKSHTREVPRGLKRGTLVRHEGAMTGATGILRKRVAIEANITEPTELLGLEDLEAE